MDNMELNQYKWHSENDFLGQGTFAEVFKAHNDKGNFVALKIATEATTDSGTNPGQSSIRAKYRLEEEYAKGKDLSHTNIIRYWDLDYLIHVDHMNRKSKNAVLIMEYADKGNLENKLENGQRPSEADTVKIAKEILSGLEYLHGQKIIHRDLKPANILFKTDRNGYEVAKLTDFGISRDMLRQEVNELASSTTGVGTSFYMAPEQFLKKTYGLNASISNRTDIWAWGVILYRMLTGSLPFGTGTADYEIMQQKVTETEPDYKQVPEKYRKVLKACLQKHAGKRPENEKEILELLEGKESKSPFDRRPPVSPVPPPIVVPEAVLPKPYNPDATDFQPQSSEEVDPGRKTNSKKTAALVIVGLVILAGIAATAIFSGHKPHGDSDTSRIDPPVPVKPASNVTFNYTPTKPVNPQTKGVVELGATGFNSFVINVDKNKNWDLAKAEYGNSQVSEHMANDDDIKKGLKNYINGMIEYGVPANDIHFVVSSGASRDQNVQRIIKVLEQMGYVVNTVTAEQEGSYALRAALPAKYYNDGFVVDMGSSNTKIAYTTSSNVAGDASSMETYGSKYFEQGITDSTVYNGVCNVSKGMPANKRSICFIIGGVPHDLADSHREGKERFTILKTPGDYNDLAEKNGQKVKSGLNIYKAIRNTTGCTQFVFDWNSNFTIGFLLTLNN